MSEETNPGEKPVNDGGNAPEPEPESDGDPAALGAEKPINQGGGSE
jgi:hypothetical protein